MDVRRLEPPAAEVWWSSPPCQAWSTAGAKLGAQDERNGWPWVWEAYDRAAVKPRWLFVENVAGMTHHSKAGHGDPLTCAGCYLAEVVLPELRARFPHVVSKVLDAADYGVPQHRRRLFIVASVEPYTWPTPTHGDGRAAYVTSGQAIGLVDDGVRIIGGGGNPHGAGRAHERNFRDLTDEPMVTVTAVRVGNRGPWIRDRLDLYDPSYEPQRPYTLDEAAAWQGFPARWPWAGSEAARHRQVGNAVPPALARALAEQVVP
jgi:DNA (cytosine-5)-methyltransferase 1